MKKVKWISLLLAFALLLGTLGIGSIAAATDEVLVRGIGGVYELDRTYPAPAANTNGASAITAAQFQTGDPDAPYLFYTNLNQMQKDVYDALAAQDVTTFAQQPDAQESGLAAVEIPLTTPITFDAEIYIDQNGDEVVDIPQEYVDMILQATLGGFSAIVSDRPDLFWLGNFTLDLVKESHKISATVSHVECTGLIAYLYLPAGYNSWEAVASDYAAMMQVVDNFTVRGNTRYEKIKYIHDWIAGSVKYDTQFQYDTSYYATSVFLEPHITVCEGYSEAFKMLCDREGIPCIQIIGDAGGPHAWNYVKMEDGNWYAVDVTWDDSDTFGTFYDYLLIGADATTRYYSESEADRTTFAQSHVPTGVRYTSDGVASYVLTYPALAAESYTPGLLLNPDAQVSVYRAENILYVYSDAALSDVFTSPVGYSLGFADDGSAVYVYESGNTQPVGTYTVVRVTVETLLGDVNKDGQINALDARWVLQAAAGMRYLDYAQALAANVYTQDGISAADARWILQASAGMRDLAA